jgi:hypothetical protein
VHINWINIFISDSDAPGHSIKRDWPTHIGELKQTIIDTNEIVRLEIISYRGHRLRDRGGGGRAGQGSGNAGRWEEAEEGKSKAIRGKS